MPAKTTDPTIKTSAAAEALSLLYIALIAAAASLTGFSLLLFPELAALSHDVMTRPWGKWASQPLRLIATPVLTAIIGTLITRHLPYHVLTILLIVALSMLTIAILRSAIAPAISAGVLPLVLGNKSWMYPLGILVAGVAMVALLIGWRAFRGGQRPKGNDANPPDVDDALETPPHGRGWMVAFILFVTVAGLAAQTTGLRFILFPPLIVMAYEMFGHPATCPWAKRPVTFPIACFLTAASGVIATHSLGAGAFAAACSMGCGVVVLRAFQIHMPPALAVGLIPLVMDKPELRYAFSVGAGTVALTISFLAWRQMQAPFRTPPPARHAGNRWIRRSSL